MTDARPDVDVLSLVIAEHGSDHDSPVMVLHGLFGSGRNWMTASRRLADRYHVLAPDLRNHGSSPWSDTMTYAAMAADVVALLERRTRPVSLVGHSMGGKAAMLVALTRPDLVDRLAVVDVAPVAYAHGFEDYARAMRDVDLSGVIRRAQVDAALTPAVPDPGVRAFLQQNLLIEGGVARWRVNLPVLERQMPTIAGFPDVDELAYEGPTLFIAGGRSDYVSTGQAPVVRRLFPRAELAVVTEAGHWVHAERLEDFLAVLEPFLAGTAVPAASPFG